MRLQCSTCHCVLPGRAETENDSDDEEEEEEVDNDAGECLCLVRFVGRWFKHIR